MQLKNLSHALSIKKTSYATNKTVSPINTHKNPFSITKDGRCVTEQLQNK